MAVPGFTCTGGGVALLLGLTLLACGPADVESVADDDSGLSAGWPTLSLNSSNPQVTAAQYLLRHHGAAIELDGHFGPDTQVVVRDFQARHGIAADGVIGASTWRALVAGVTVAEGDHGVLVEAVQYLLRYRGHPQLTVDGEYASATVAAMTSFQRQHCVSPADGGVGPATWQALIVGAGCNGAPGGTPGKDKDGVSSPGDDGTPGSNGFIWPVRGPLTSGFGMRWGRLHAGVDIAADTGVVIQAAAGGTVKTAAASGGYGNLIELRHASGTHTLYGHCSELLVHVGATVRQGQVIGRVGSTGNSTGPHLHFEVRPGGGEPVDPLGYLPK
jgi:peptidoglycan hydrolase-like protein with peptidoglycan-binding domain